MNFETSRRKAIALRGRRMTLNRIGGGGINPLNTTSLDVVGTLAYYTPNEILGDIRSGDAQVALTNDELRKSNWTPAYPRARDQIVIDQRTYTVKGCWPCYDGETCIGYNLWISG